MIMRNTYLILVLSLSSLLIYACKRKKVNERLYEETISSDLTFYNSKDTIYSAKGGSPHGSFKLKFNAIANAVLGADGKLPQGSSFPEGSLIVKEAYSGNELVLYAIMKRELDSKFSKDKWVWAEYEPNGDVVYSVSLKGKACIDCHKSGLSRDLVRAFDLH